MGTTWPRYSNSSPQSSPPSPVLSPFSPVLPTGFNFRDFFYFRGTLKKHALCGTHKNYFRDFCDFCVTFLL